MDTGLPTLWLQCRRRFGRKLTMLLSGILFDIGVVLITAAWSLWVLIVARILLGFAIAFASVVVPLYNSEMAPAHYRGRLNQLWQVYPPPDLLMQVVLRNSRPCVMHQLPVYPKQCQVGRINLRTGANQYGTLCTMGQAVCIQLCCLS